MSKSAANPDSNEIFDLLFGVENSESLDLSNDDSLRTLIIVVTSIFMISVILALALRLYSKIFVSQKLQRDDVAAIIGTIGALALFSVTLHLLSIGYGEHIWFWTVPELVPRTEQTIKELYACTALHTFSITMAKTSIIFLYNRIFDSHLWFRRVMTVVLAISWAILIVLILVTLFQCSPLNAAWDVKVMTAQKHTCINMQAFLYAATSINIATELVLVVLPLFPIASLKLPKRKKIAVCLLFLVGCFSCVASIIRLYSLRKLRDVDISYTTVNALLWSIFEVGVALIVASCPAIRTIFTHYNIPIFSKILCCAKNSSDQKDKRLEHSSAYPSSPYIYGSRILNTSIPTTTDPRTQSYMEPYEAELQNIDLGLAPGQRPDTRYGDTLSPIPGEAYKREGETITKLPA